MQRPVDASQWRFATVLVYIVNVTVYISITSDYNLKVRKVLLEVNKDD
jgi:hypothetical protein